MIQTQLHRSANAPLVLDLDWSDSDGTPLGDSSLLEALVPHCERWHSIRLTYPTHDLLDLLRPAKGRLPQLQSLEFIYSGDSESTSSLETDFFSTAPKLREVLLATGDLEYSTNLTFPWRQISRYRGVYPVSQQLDILESAPNLIQCSIGFDEARTDDDRMITLPHLSQLCVEKSFLLDHLTAPHLESLFTQGSVDALPPFIRRSSCTLTTLVLTRCHLTGSPTPEALIPLLQNSPALQNLRVEPDGSAPGPTRDFLDAMRLSDSHLSSNICPDLRSFAYGFLGALDLGFSHDAFFSMLQSRLTARCRLTCVRVFSTRSDVLFSAVMESRMQALADEGLDAAIVYGVEATALIEKDRP